MKVDRDSSEDSKPDVSMEEEISDLESSEGEDVKFRVLGRNDAVKQEDSGSARGEDLSADSMLREVETNAVGLRVNPKRSIPMPSSAGTPTITAGSAQLTVFHNGKLSVFDGIPSEKVQEILSIAVAAAKSAKTTNVIHPAFTRSVSFQSATAHGSEGTRSHFVRQNSFCGVQADLPIARRHSLKRFLEKRRDRHLSTNSYQNSSAGKNAAMNADKTPTEIAPETLQQTKT